MITILTLLGCSVDEAARLSEEPDAVEVDDVQPLQEPTPLQGEAFELVFTNTPGTLEVDGTHQLVVEARSGGEPTALTQVGLVTYESLQPAIAEVDAAGVVTANATGLALFKARTDADTASEVERIRAASAERVPEIQTASDTEMQKLQMRIDELVAQGCPPPIAPGQLLELLGPGHPVVVGRRLAHADDLAGKPLERRDARHRRSREALPR